MLEWLPLCHICRPVSKPQQKAFLNDIFPIPCFFMISKWFLMLWVWYSHSCGNGMLSLPLQSTGGFDQSKTSAGSIACLNIWHSTRSSEELLRFSNCNNKGNLFHLSATSGYIHGGVMAQVSTTSGEIKLKFVKQ